MCTLSLKVACAMRLRLCRFSWRQTKFRIYLHLSYRLKPVCALWRARYGLNKYLNLTLTDYDAIKRAHALAESSSSSSSASSPLLRVRTKTPVKNTHTRHFSYNCDYDKVRLCTSIMCRVFYWGCAALCVTLCLQSSLSLCLFLTLGDADEI